MFFHFDLEIIIITSLIRLYLMANLLDELDMALGRGGKKRGIEKYYYQLIILVFLIKLHNLKSN
jgi:hypothetical protein